MWHQSQKWRLKDITFQHEVLRLNFSTKCLKVKTQPKHCFLAEGFGIRTIILTSHLSLEGLSESGHVRWHYTWHFPSIQAGRYILPRITQNHNKKMLGCQVTTNALFAKFACTRTVANPVQFVNKLDKSSDGWVCDFANSSATRARKPSFPATTSSVMLVVLDLLNPVHCMLVTIQ